jgi:hypothetical protein
MRRGAGGAGVAPLKHPGLLDKFLEALKDWNCGGVIEWKPAASEWLSKNLECLSQKAIGKLMWQHVADGGEIDQVVETREPYRDCRRFHYDFRVPITGRVIYVETLLLDTKAGPTIYVVSIHNA